MNEIVFPENVLLFGFNPFSETTEGSRMYELYFV